MANLEESTPIAAACPCAMATVSKQSQPISRLSLGSHHPTNWAGARMDLGPPSGDPEMFSTQGDREKIPCPADEMHVFF